MTPHINQRKSEIRTAMQDRLAAMSEDERRRASAAACSRLIGMEAFIHAGTVMLYMPIKTELDLTPLAIRCFQLGKTVCVPKVDWSRREMSPIEVSSFDDNVMEIDDHGLRSPRDGRIVVPTVIDMVIVPGLAFDTSGRRLGRGGGYYDRFLARLRPSAVSVGICYDAQVVDTVPSSPKDVTVDILVTDRRVSLSGRSRSRQ